MERSQSRIVMLVAVGQVLPLVLFPWSLSTTSAVFIVVLIALSAFLGWALIRRRPWARTLTIFVQGINVVVRIITLFSNVYQPEAGWDVPLLITYIASVALAVTILNYMDKPEVQLIFET